MKRARVLRLKSGLRWRGKLTVERFVEGEGYLVQFDAVIVGAAEGEARFVYDRTVLTADQLEAWTGWREP